jgi:hypothetical protein
VLREALPRRPQPLVPVSFESGRHGVQTGNRDGRLCYWVFGICCHDLRAQ